MNIANPEKKEEALNNEIKEIDTKNNQIMEIINENIELLNENTSKLIKYAQKWLAMVLLEPEEKCR